MNSLHTYIPEQERSRFFRKGHQKPYI